MKIIILGTGCPKCKKLYAEAEKAIASSGLKVDLEKVEKIEEILKYGVLAMPGLILNEGIRASGRVPESSEIESWIKACAEKLTDPRFSRFFYCSGVNGRGCIRFQIPDFRFQIETPALQYEIRNLEF